MHFAAGNIEFYLLARTQSLRFVSPGFSQNSSIADCLARSVPSYGSFHSHGCDNDQRACSVQGYGQKAPGIGAFVYPGSGATCDTRPASAGAATDTAHPSGAGAGTSDQVS